MYLVNEQIYTRYLKKTLHARCCFSGVQSTKPVKQYHVRIFCQRSYYKKYPLHPRRFRFFARAAAGVTLRWTEDRKRFSTWTPGDRSRERSRTVPRPTEGGQAARTALKWVGKVVPTALKGGGKVFPTPTGPKPPKVPLRRDKVTLRHNRFRFVERQNCRFAEQRKERRLY